MKKEIVFAIAITLGYFIIWLIFGLFGDKLFFHGAEIFSLPAWFVISVLMGFFGVCIASVIFVTIFFKNDNDDNEDGG